MRTKVPEHGVLIPKTWLEGVDEVEIRKEQNVIITPRRSGHANSRASLDSVRR